MLAALLVLAMAASPAPALAVPGSAACPTELPRIVEESNFNLPDGAHATNPRVNFLIDVGSDGRVRRTAMIESSGDALIDAAASKAIAQFRFAPPSYACVAISTVMSQGWNIAPEDVASPVPSASPAATLACAAPFVRPSSGNLPRHREVPGTVTVDVSLNAQAQVTAVHLAQSSGNPKTDYAATTTARNLHYVFQRQPGCAASATVYRLELTFR